MDLQGISEDILRRPFESFSIRLEDGRKLPVRQPQCTYY